MTILKARFNTGEEFLKSYDLSFAHGGIFIPTRRAIPVGDGVVVAVQIGKRQDPVMMRGHVAWRRSGQHKTKIRAGMAIEFLASERSKRDYLLAAARGSVPGIKPRRHLRLPVDLPVSWRPSDSAEELAGTLRDIGRGGAFVRTTLPVAVPGESDVVLNLAAPGGEVPTPYAARVAWVGQAEGESGFGVSWRSRDAGGSRRIRELVRRIELASA